MSANLFNKEIRFATFNASLNRSNAGELIVDLSTPNNDQAKAVAEIIQSTNPDVLLLNEFDYDADAKAIENFQKNYLEVSQNGMNPVEYPYVYLAPSNTGIDSGFDFDNNGSTGDPDDAFGFGSFPGQFGMVLLSKYPIETDQVRTFQNFLWKDMPNALLPEDPSTSAVNDWYSQEELEVFRLSSKSHWDIPVNVNGQIIHVLASHPTPPTFDGEEDRNGRRNHDEIRFWADYINPSQGNYIYDDNGKTGGLKAGESFVIMGDQNADPKDGDSTDNAILQLLDNPQVNTSMNPSSQGGIEATIRQKGANETHQGNPAFDTADFNDDDPGNLRVDYVLPSANLAIKDTGVFWPTSLFKNVISKTTSLETVEASSDHRLVYADVNLKPKHRLDAGVFWLTNLFENPINKTSSLQTVGAISDRHLVYTNVNLKFKQTKVASVEFIGETSFPTGFNFENTEVGGLSAIVYNPNKEVYYALSDDRSQTNPARFYTLNIELSDGKLDDGDINFKDVTILRDRHGNAFAEASIDPEGITLTKNGTLFISSEGDADNLINPFVNEFSLQGKQIDELPVDDKFLPTEDQSSGIRNNLAFESLTVTPNQRYLYTATENALNQDGPTADIDQGSLSRIIKYDLRSRQPVQEFVYPVGEVAETPEPEDDLRTNGLVELLALDNNGTLLGLERSFSTGKGNTVKLYEIRTQLARDVSNTDDIFNEAKNKPVGIQPTANKRLLVDFADLGVTPDNLEGLALGPKLGDGRQSLIVVSDNNFSETQETQFVALALDIETSTVSGELPKYENKVLELKTGTDVIGVLGITVWIFLRRLWKRKN